MSGGVGVFIECGSLMKLWRGMKWIEEGEEERREGDGEVFGERRRGWE